MSAFVSCDFLYLYTNFIYLSGGTSFPYSCYAIHLFYPTALSSFIFFLAPKSIFSLIFFLLHFLHSYFLTSPLQEYRILSDSIQYRHGHNSQDDPSITQPLIYDRIKNHPATLEIYQVISIYFLHLFLTSISYPIYLSILIKIRVIFREY